MAAGTICPGVAFVLKGYPRLSETFIAQEIAALEERGLRIRIFSLRHPADERRHPVHDEIRAGVSYLPEYIHQEPARVLRAWWRMRRLPAYRELVRIWLRDLARDRSANRVRRFFQALVLADELPADFVRLHAHFLHTPASVTRYAAQLRGLPWSASAHAKDIWTSPAWEKREKLASCDWVVTCTAANHAHLSALAPAGRVGLVYHGLDTSRFPPIERPAGLRDGSNAAAPVIILSVGRLVPKKGFDTLIEALARLPAGLNWRLAHVGGGPLGKELRQLAHRLGIAGRITWHGALDQPGLLIEYRGADLFALACRITDDGDRDGLPNVLMEAQSQSLACVSTAISGVGELILHEETGILVQPDSPAELAHAIERLIRDPQLRVRLGAAGRRRVAEQFSLAAGIDDLAQRFGLSASANAHPGA
jgi:glycosyltransferase involved in cell wall biosynthesis